MELKVFTVYNRIDGSSDGMFTARSESRVIRDLKQQVSARNETLKAKNYPPINLNEMEVRYIADFDDVTSKINPLPSPIVVGWDLTD